MIQKEDKMPVEAVRLRLRRDTWAQVVAYAAMIESSTDHVLTEAFKTVAKETTFQEYWKTRREEFIKRIAEKATKGNGKRGRKSQVQAAYS